MAQKGHGRGDVMRGDRGKSRSNGWGYERISRGVVRWSVD